MYSDLDISLLVKVNTKRKMISGIKTAVISGNTSNEGKLCIKTGLVKPKYLMPDWMAIQPKKEPSKTRFMGTRFELTQTNAIKNDKISVVRINDSTINCNDV